MSINCLMIKIACLYNIQLKKKECAIIIHTMTQMKLKSNLLSELRKRLKQMHSPDKGLFGNVISGSKILRCFGLGTQGCCERRKNQYKALLHWLPVLVIGIDKAVLSDRSVFPWDIGKAFYVLSPFPHWPRIVPRKLMP